MKYFEKQPLFTFTLLFTLGMFLLSPITHALRATVAVLALITFICAVYFRFSQRHIVKKGLSVIITVGLSLLCASSVSIIYNDITVPRQCALSGTSANITAVIKDEIYIENYASSYYAEITEINGEDTDISSILTLPYEFSADIGDKVALSAELTVPLESENGFPLRKYYASKNIHITAEGDENGIVFVGKQEDAEMFFTKLSSRLSARLRLRLGNEYGGLASGLLFGRRDDISDSAKRDFRFLGISHILSVSGLHLSIIVGGMLSLLRRLKAPRTVRFAVCSLLIVFMTLLTGMPASVIRSGIMMFLMLLASLIGRKEDPINSLFTASALILLFSPSSVHDAGFILSFSATLGLITLGRYFASRIMPKTEKKKLPKRLLGKVLMSFSATLAAVIFTLPFSYYFFGEASLVSFIANLIFVPLSGVYLFTVIGAIIFSDPIIGGAFNTVCRLLSGLIIFLSERLASIVPEPISLMTFSAKLAVSLAFVALIMLVFIKKKRIIYLIIPFAVWCIVFSASTHVSSEVNRATVDIVAVSLKKNDFILIGSEGKTLLCDFSDGRYSQAKNAVSLVETELYDTSVDVILLTHLHSYHKTTFKRLADNNRISTLILPLPSDNDGKAISEELSDAASSLGIEVLTYSAADGSSLTFGDCNILIEPSAYIDRSVQPINTVTLQTDGGTMSYIGASAFESDADFEKVIKKSDTIWLGVHGPNIKMQIPDNIKLGHTYASNKTVNEGYSAYFDEINDGERYFIKFRSE